MEFKSWKSLAIAAGVGISAAFVIKELYFEQKKDIVIIHKDHITEKIQIPRRHLGFVVGKKGTQIKMIREKTGAHICILHQANPDTEFVDVEIKGADFCVDLAVEEIKSLISGYDLQTCEVVLLEETWASVIGINGDNIRRISCEANLTITVKWLPSDQKEIETKACKYAIILKGTKEQIEHATSLIDESIVYATVVEPVKTVGVAGRYLLENTVPTVNSSVLRESFPESMGKDFVQVFVSAVESPSKFWVQICGPRSVQLDKLTIEMTGFYNQEVRNPSSFLPESVMSGDLVAALYHEDNDWYRALVLSVEKVHLEKSSATVLFVDFGDTAVVNFGLIMKLKPEYLSIPLQAIKCSLYNVLPADDRWSQDGIKMFERITHLAEWKPIMAKPMYDNRRSNDNCTSTQCEMPDIVEVHLVDTNSTVDIVISEELQKAGYASFTQKPVFTGIASVNSN